MSLLDKLLGRPLATWEAEEERIGPVAGIPILGLDGLSSAAYGPEAALTVLLPLGLVGLAYVVPITVTILILLGILYFSYRQTIAAYPNGGGSYVVAKENLGMRAGLVAAAALLLDYILNVAVGISAGVGALVSAIPALQPHVLLLCLVTLALLAVMNLRGMRESGIAFGIPTFAFVGLLGMVLVLGIFRAPVHHAAPVVSGAASLWILLRSFASGCTAMTGVEAVSNAVPAFREPRVGNAQRTLTAIVVILAGLLAGIAYLARAYGIMAMDQTKPGYQSILSLLVQAVLGRGVIYYVTIASVLAVLSFSANTSFAGFPRLCRLIAEDKYLPSALANVGRRLVYSGGIVVLTILSALLLIVFDGITDRLIPLFAIGAFGAFTLSQAGMVMHWRRVRGRGYRSSLAINAVGAVATAIALGIIIVAKFEEGAWISLVLIPAMLALFFGVRRHYDNVTRQIAIAKPLDATKLEAPVVVIPISGWSSISEKALRLGLTMSQDVVALHVVTDEDKCQALETCWKDLVEGPARNAGVTPPKLITIASPYRRLFKPILDYIDSVAPERQVAVIIPDLVERRWWEYPLHNHRGDVLRTLLLLRGNARVVVISVPWYLKRERRKRSRAAPNELPLNRHDHEA